MLSNIKRLLHGFKMPARAIVENLPAESDFLVRLHNVGKHYGDFWALRSISLDVRKGESLGIIGLNGAGKSTLLQVIAGSLPPSEGQVKVHGRIAMLLQLGMGFDEDFTGLENLYMSASLHGLSKETIDTGLPEIEGFAEIGDFLNKPVRTYSSGMKMRLAFALLTQLEPAIIVIDEALSVGDAYFSHKCARLLHRLRDEGKSLLFVSHDPGAVKTFCDRAILLEKGILVRDGPPTEVLEYYNAIIALKEKERESYSRDVTISKGKQIKSGDGKVVIARWDLLDVKGKSVRAVLCGSTVTLACYVEFADDVTSPTIGLLIRDRLGNDVFGTNTCNLSLTTGERKAGTGMEVAFDFPVNLGPGNYSITLAAHVGRDHRDGNFDWRDNLIPFSVLPNWPFVFSGIAALPVQSKLNEGAYLLSRRVEFGNDISFSADGNAHRFVKSGWAYPEQNLCWTLGDRAVLEVCLPEAASSRLIVDIMPLLAPTLKEQRVVLELAGKEIARWSMDHPGTYEAQIPAPAPTLMELELVFVLPDAASPKELGLSDDARRLAIAFRSARFVRSASS